MLYVLETLLFPWKTAEFRFWKEFPIAHKLLNSGQYELEVTAHG